MVTYDFIVGLKLGKYHSKTLKYERVDLDDNSPKEIYKRLGAMVSSCFDDSREIPNRKDIQQALSMTESILAKSEVTKEDLDVVDNCFDVIAYFGIEADAFRRDDGVVPVTEPKAVMAFVVNTKVEGVDERIAPALGLMTDDNSLASMNDMVMETFRSRIRINPSLEALIRLDSQIENWEMMSRVGASGDMDTSRLLTLLNDMGFDLKIFLS